MGFWRCFVFFIICFGSTGFYFLSEVFVVNTPLVEGWTKIKYVSSNIRKNPLFLKKYLELLDDLNIYKRAASYAQKVPTLFHHIEGFAKSGNVKGGHLISKAKERLRDADGNEFSFIKITDEGGNAVPIDNLPKNRFGVVKADPSYKVEMAQYDKRLNGTLIEPYQFKQYRQKKNPDGHTFFPERMSYEQIMEEFASALINPSKITAPATYAIEHSAASYSGMIIGWYEKNGKIITFFPKF